MPLVDVTVALALTALTAFPLLAADVRRAPLAFHYARSLRAAELETFAHFETLVTHDPLPRAQVDALHARGTKLVLYEWAVAFYASRATPWQRSLLGTRALLNPRPLRGHLGATDSDAWYFDPATHEHAKDRAKELQRALQSIGYDGVFLDTTTVASVHADARAEYEARHPDMPYDEAFARFLAALREEKLLVITNQGFREPKHILPYATRDVSESLITFPRNGRFVFRPWNDAADPWNSIDFLMRKLIARGQRITHLNYLDTPEPRQIETIAAIARLYSADAYVSVPSLDRATNCACYFANLGKSEARVSRPLGAYRRFARGLVAVNAAHSAMRIANRDAAQYEDVVTGERYRGKTIVIPAAIAEEPRGVVLRRIDR